MQSLLEARVSDRRKTHLVFLVVGSVILGLVAQLFLNRLVDRQLIFFLIPPVILAAWFYNFRVSLVTAVVCAAAADYFLFAPQFALDLANPYDLITLAAYLAITLPAAWVFSKLASKTQLLSLAQNELQMTLRSIGDAVLVVDAHRNVAFLNPIAEILTGWSLDEARGKSVDEVFQIFNQSTKAPAFNPIERVLAEGVVVGLANHTILLAKDGTEYQIEDSAAPIRVHEDGLVSGVVLVFRDVTARYAIEAKAKCAEESLGQSQRLLDQIFNEAPAYMVIVNYPELTFARANQEYQKLVGREDLVGRKVTEVLPKFEAEGLLGLVSRVATSKERFVGVEVPITIQTPNGEAKEEFFDFIYQPLINTAGNVYAILGQGTSVTEKVKARRVVEDSERRYREAQEQLRLALASAQMGAWTIDLVSGKTVVSEEARQIFGYEAEYRSSSEAIDKFLHPEERERGKAVLAHSIANNLPYQHEFRIVKPTGEVRWIYSRGHAQYNKEGKAVLLTGVVMDITERKIAEAELLVAKGNAERANQLKSAFLANMSHEIRTPLGAMIGFADLLRDPSLGPSERDNYTEILSRNGESLSVIINDILDLSKVEAGQLSLEFTEVKLREVAEDVISLLRVKAKEKNLALEFETDPNSPEIIVSDPIRVRQVLLNIISNAIKFTPYGSVKLKASPCKVHVDRDAIAFEVTDTGIGIEESQKDKVFEMFVQADGSMTRRFGGTGLGLALSKRLVQALGGDIEITQTEPGKGSTFRITIHHQPEKRDTSVGIQRPKKQAVEVTPNALAGLKILVVDDSPDNRQLIWRYLARQGAVVEAAENGLVGYRQALAGNYDVILMDLQMPIMDGYTATHKLRSAGYRKPIIALTAHAMTDVRQKCMNVGCNAHLPKPIDPNVLISAIVELQAAALATQS